MVHVVVRRVVVHMVVDLVVDHLVASRMQVVVGQRSLVEAIVDADLESA